MAITNQDQRSQTAVKYFLDETEKGRAELVRERDNAARFGDLEFALQSSKDLRALHKDYLEGSLLALRIEYARARQRVQDSKLKWPPYEFYKKILGPEAADAKQKEWQAAKAKEDPQESAAPFTSDALTIDLVGDEFTKRIQEERSFLENLVRAAHQKRNWTLVRAGRKELRLLQKDLLEGQLEIDKFERDNPSPVDLYAKTAEIMELRFKFIDLIKEAAERSGIDLENPERPESITPAGSK